MQEDALSITFVENTIELGQLEPLAEALHSEAFFDIPIRHRSAGPASTPLGGDIALWIVIALSGSVAIAAKSFLEELGKDLYHRGFLPALSGAYRTVRTWANARGYAPLAIRMVYGSGPSVTYRFPQGLSDEAFERALKALLASYDEVDRSPRTPQFIFMAYNEGTNAWVESHVK